MAEYKNTLTLQTESGQRVSIDLRNALILSTAPTASTAARAGMQAYVVSGGKITAEYVCTAVSGSTYTWVQREVSGGGGSEIPDYVQAEAEATAAKVLGHQSEDSFAVAWISDTHVGAAYQALGWKTDETCIIECGQGLYALNERCPVDVIMLGGDHVEGASGGTREAGLEQLDLNEELLRPATFVIPTLRLMGNHDDAPFRATEGRITPLELYQRIGRKNISAGAVVVPGRNFGYRDFDEQKMRVIYLDTHDKIGWLSSEYDPDVYAGSKYMDACNISASQLDWLANTALDFSGKSTPGEWGFVIGSHVPLNYALTDHTYTDVTSGTSYKANTGNVITILEAYINGESGSITLNGETMSYDFTALEEKARLYCCINGHVHAQQSYRYGDIKILGIGCPNARDINTVASDDGVTYSKTAGTGESTAFDVLTIDRVNDKIYVDNYGAGADRVFDAPVYRQYTNVLATAWTPPDSPTEDSGSATVVSSEAEKTDGSALYVVTVPYDGVGYKNGCILYGWRLSGPENRDGYVKTGVIKWRDNPGEVDALPQIYIYGAELDVLDDFCRLQIIQWNSDTSPMGSRALVRYSEGNWDLIFTVETLGDKYYRLTPKGDAPNVGWWNIRAFMMSLKGRGEDLIITLGEPIW